MKNIPLRHAKLAAFREYAPKEHEGVGGFPDSHTFGSGNTRGHHFRQDLGFACARGASGVLEENLEMIRDSVSFLKSHGREVTYDAEHFFDGFKSNEAYALQTLKAAEEAGADCIVLCDTNGGTMPTEIPAIMAKVRETVKLPIGVHTHNDAGMAVANSVVAVYHGATHVQGTINGYGERCGNADLIQVIPNLELKLKKRWLATGETSGTDCSIALCG